MSATSPRWTVASVCLLVIVSGCSFHTTAPKGWLPTAVEAQREAYGGWIKLDFNMGVQPKTVQGELIAAAPDTVYVLTSDSLVVVPTTSVTAGTLTAYDAQHGALRLWTILGTVSTLSHGFVLILSAPVWGIAGLNATASASKAPRVESTDPSLLRMYARFPQGLPPGLDARSLRQKDVRTLDRRDRR
jgi:hypothetical protein